MGSERVRSSAGFQHPWGDLLLAGVGLEDPNLNGFHGEIFPGGAFGHPAHTWGAACTPHWAP